MAARAFIRSEVLGSEQWIGAGSTVWQVVDPAKTTVENSEGIVHQAAILPFRRVRCLVWGFFHGYGILHKQAASGVGNGRANRLP